MSGSQSFEDVYNVQTKRIAELEAENARLREAMRECIGIIDNAPGYDKEKMMDNLCGIVALHLERTLEISTPSTQAENVSKNSGEIDR